MVKRLFRVVIIPFLGWFPPEGLFVFVVIFAVCILSLMHSCGLIMAE